MQARIADYDTLSTRVAELPSKLTHPVMVRLLSFYGLRPSIPTGLYGIVQIPLGKRASIPGKIVRSNEILTHLGDDYFAWQSAAEATAVIDRKKKGNAPIEAAEPERNAQILQTWARRCRRPKPS